MKQLLFLILLPSILLAHGVEHEVLAGGAGLRVTYGDGSPMGWVEVTVFSPVDSHNPHQVGMSDGNGAFSFIPDTVGTWTMVFDDGLGHGLRQEILITSDGVAAPGAGPHIPLPMKVVSGIAVIFGVTSLLYARSLNQGHV